MIRLVALCISKLTPRVCCHCSQHCFRFRKCLYYKEVVLYESVVSVKAFFNVVLLGLGRQRTEGKRAFSNEPWGMSQPDFTRLSLFCFPLCLSLSHFVLCVLTRCLSWVLLMLLYNLSNLCSSLCPSFFFLSYCLFPFRFLCFSLSPSYLPSFLWALHQLQLCDGKSMWQYPATTNTHLCQLMTLTGIPRCTSPWLPGWAPAESAVKSRTLAALPVQCTVEVTSATQDDIALADSATYALSLSSIFTVAFVRGRGREAEEWETWKINWLYLGVKVFLKEGDGCLRRNAVLLSRSIREDPISLFPFSSCFFTHSPKYLSVLIFQVLRQQFV